MESQKYKQETKLLGKYYKLIKKKKTKLDMFKTHLPTYKTNLQVKQKKNIHKIIVPWVKFGTNQTLL